MRMPTIIAAVAILLLAACQAPDRHTGTTTAVGAGLGAVSGGIIGVLADNPGAGAAVGALVGGLSGLLYDQYDKGREQHEVAPTSAVAPAPGPRRLTP